MKNNSLQSNRAIVLDKFVNSEKPERDIKFIQDQEKKYSSLLTNLSRLYTYYLQEKIDLSKKIKKAIIVFSGLDEEFFNSLKHVHEKRFGKGENTLKNSSDLLKYEFEIPKHEDNPHITAKNLVFSTESMLDTI